MTQSPTVAAGGWCPVVSISSPMFERKQCKSALLGDPMVDTPTAITNTVISKMQSGQLIIHR